MLGSDIARAEDNESAHMLPLDRETQVSPETSSHLHRRHRAAVLCAPSAWTVIAVILLLSLLWTRVSRNDSCCPQRRSVTVSQYGRNRDYMSLSHDFDSLWNELADETQGYVNANGTTGLITM
ncbi:hypothetical protein FOPE_04881 [Fonsecaea pedrosoi]|nr:hypothetical protein FOPE_04881 [Fonsecaea pedrosoi]